MLNKTIAGVTRIRTDKKNVLALDLHNYSIGDMQTSMQDIHILRQDDNILHTDGFGFMVLNRNTLFTYETGFIYCSGLYLFDPLRGRHVISHLPINDQDIEHFLNVTFPAFTRFLEQRSIALSSSRLHYIFGTSTYEDMYCTPGYIVSRTLQERYKLRFTSVLPAHTGKDRFLYDLQRGDLKQIG